MEKIFKLKENGTTVRTEIVAGLTTFMTMAYIIALNPNLLTGFAVGTPLWNGVFLATCIASAIGMFAMAFLANKPFCLAPGMGLNSFFAVVVANIMVITKSDDYTSCFQAALVIPGEEVQIQLQHIGEVFLQHPGKNAGGQQRPEGANKISDQHLRHLHVLGVDAGAGNRRALQALFFTVHGHSPLRPARGR